jgi:hypothetical protein
MCISALSGNPKVDIFVYRLKMNETFFNTLLSTMWMKTSCNAGF